jgi:para-aminobenzoate synthetase component I
MAMPQVQIISLPYYEDSAAWFLAIRHLPNPAWLDSGRPQSELGRYDILVADPVLTLTTEGSKTQIQTKTTDEFSTENPFTLLSRHLQIDSSLKSAPSLKNDSPFMGGALGYWAYDLAWRLENLPRKNQKDIELPEMQLGIYSWAIIQDHLQKTSVLMMNQAIDPTYNFSVIQDICRQKPMFHNLKQLIKSPLNLFKINALDSNLNVGKYASMFASVQNYIKAGDCYQINLAQRFSSSYQGDSLLAYLHLRQQLPSPFSAFMQWDGGSVLSFSPERFLQVRSDKIETKPIKGTIARGKNPEEDLRNAQWLQSSQKNRAENVMIVDLLRNDLSKHATQVEVPHLCELQSFANVHHLVSTVTGKLKPESSPVDLLRDAFPGGSITGAPKIRAMEIIEELEPHQRSIYCGSIGYISVDGQMDTNIAIRTVVCDKNNIHCWGGGGIVADSICDKEYEETLAKVNVILQNLQNNFSGK